MATAKRHHYLPQFYLERFTDADHLLWVFDRDLKVLRKQQPKDTAVQGYYYAFTDKDGNRRNDIEEFFSKIESETKPILDRVDQGELLSDEDKLTLSAFIAFQKTRVPDFEKSMDEVSEKMMRHLNGLMFHSEEAVAQTLRQYEADTGKSEKTNPKDLFEFVQKGDYGIEFARENNLALMMELGKELVGHLVQMDWTFIRAPERSSFITSDNPFLLIPPRNYDPKGFYGVGIASPGATKVIPLSARTCLLIGDYGNATRNAMGDSTVVRQINLSAAINSDRFIFGRAKPLLQKIVGVTKVDQWKKESRVQVG